MKIASSTEDDRIIFYYLQMFLGENGDAIVVAKLSQRDQGGTTKVWKDVRLGSRWGKTRGKWKMALMRGLHGCIVGKLDQWAKGVWTDIAESVGISLTKIMFAGTTVSFGNRMVDYRMRSR